MECDIVTLEDVPEAVIIVVAIIVLVMASLATVAALSYGVYISGLKIWLNVKTNLELRRRARVVSGVVKAGHAPRGLKALVKVENSLTDDQIMCMLHGRWPHFSCKISNHVDAHMMNISARNRGYMTYRYEVKNGYTGMVFAHADSLLFELLKQKEKDANAEFDQ